MNTKEFTTSKKFHLLLLTIIGIIVALIIFQAGILVGYHRADFSRHSRENYFQAFHENRPKFLGMFGDERLPNSHGAVGKIVQINLPTLVVASPDNTENVITVTNNTEIRRQQNKILPTDISVNDSVVILGVPNSQGQIEARLIRLLPAFDSNMRSTPTQPIR